MSNTGFKRWGATSGASSASSYGHSRSDGTQYVSPSEEKKKGVKKVKTDSKPKPSGPKPGKAAVSYASSSSPHSSPASSPSVVKSTPPVQKSGLNATTYEKQPDWAFSERHKNANGQYQDGMFQGSDNPNNAYSSSPKPASSSYHSTTSSSSTTSAPKPSYASAAKPAFSSSPKPVVSSSPKPAVTSYRVGGATQASSQSSYASSAGASSDGGVTKSGLNSTTYEKQPDWAYSERSKNAHGQYKDGMFQGGGGGGGGSTSVTYGSSSMSPSALKATGKLR